MTPNEFFESKEIKIKELEENFHLVTQFNIDMINYEGCPHCKDTCNQTRWKSQSWTAVIQCIACKSIICIIFSDRMGGCHTDTVLVFEEKNRPMYNLYFKCDIQKDCIECRHCGTESSDPEDIKNKFCKKCNKTIG